jgi:hypothetical protein
MSTILGGGGIRLERCTVTDDGVVAAIEFTAVRFGPHRLQPQAGLAVYERGPSGLLHAARIYDDVNVEALSGAAYPEPHNRAMLTAGSQILPYSLLARPTRLLVQQHPIH